MTKPYKMKLHMIDVSAQARKLFGRVEFMGRDITTPDWRFEINTPTGGSVTFNKDATAEYILRYIEREGWNPQDLGR